MSPSDLDDGERWLSVGMRAEDVHAAALREATRLRDEFPTASFVLRARDEESRQQAYEVIVNGLREALRLAPARSG